MHVIVIGSAAGGGFPQWNCRCPTCALAWAGDPRVTPRTQSSLAVSADGLHWTLVNASPDLRQQILATPALHPRGGSRHSPISAVVLTNGDVDHMAGLITLRERQAFALHASPSLHAMIDVDPVFAVLDRAFVSRHALLMGEANVVNGLAVTPFAVPGKVPLFLESGEVAVGAETDMTVGLDIRANGRRLVHVPGCASVTPSLLERVRGADLLLFDGTTYTDDEMPRLGLSPKTAARMGHVAMDGPGGSLEALAGAEVGAKVYVHVNNTNPALVEGSAERRTVEAAGWRVAHDGMEFRL
ncbi:pyrroloquinoline quinone biosynthesis protein PqqB [Lichenibacterium dinghuense]|uniref:pyrroloquinoline quinone biosynthesis protein PqqB n=1 Tax=Lichenibacterium dinghuense TaxID=2895977 RepID=UPI001F011003|nr:pyrroloquinoline quinone biosynthesis protein PqqB [Lichenibacterium sp. 6Y81]